MVLLLATHIFCRNGVDHDERRRLPAWWRLGFEEKLGFFMEEMKMMTWHHLVG